MHRLNPISPLGTKQPIKKEFGPYTIEEVNSAIKKASEGELKGILEYSEIPLVSTDILNNPHSSIYDASSTQLLDNNHLKVVCWYDNEWGFSCRMLDNTAEIGKTL